MSTDEIQKQRNSSTTDLHNIRYDNHQAEWDKCISDPEFKEIGKSWLKHDTLDAWRHKRMRAPLKTIVEFNPTLSWLTIGDGRYGTDANHLLSLGAKNVHTSDISETLIKIGSEIGFINSYSAENAENLSFADDCFDWVYCKEALHHFPRPYMALHEMLRVARKGVILTEPRDPIIGGSILYSLKELIKNLLGKPLYHFHEFEPVGNYVYSISEREIEKFLLGMHYTGCAFHGCNDAYTPGVEFINLNTKIPAELKIKKRILYKIKRQDFLCSLGLRKTKILTAILFKTPPSESLTAALRNSNWNVKSLPINPYLEVCSS
jgi:ubiquinone/menaquinone biosynthesis C-methylase UbiE